MSNASIEVRWRKKMLEKLRGRQIVNVRIMTVQEAETLGWFNRSVVLQLDDGAMLYGSMDDEGNEAGAIFTTYDDLPTLPVF